MKASAGLSRVALFAWCQHWPSRKKMATAWTRAKAWTRNATTRRRISLCTKRSIQNGACRIIPPPVAATRQTANREPIAAFGGDIVKQDTAPVVAGGHGEADFTRPRSIIRDGGGDHVGDRRHHDRSPAATSGRLPLASA
jgi:hypothetical protein